MPTCSPDEEREVEALGLGLRADEVVPAEQGREDDAVAEARDGEQLGDALQQPDDDRVEVREVVHARPPRYVARPGAVRVSGRLPRCAASSSCGTPRRSAPLRAATTAASSRRGVGPRRPRCASGPRTAARSPTSAARSSSRTRRGRSRRSSSRSPALPCARGRSSTQPSTTACATSTTADVLALARRGRPRRGRPRRRRAQPDGRLPRRGPRRRPRRRRPCARRRVPAVRGRGPRLRGRGTRRRGAASSASSGRRERS